MNPSFHGPRDSMVEAEQRVEDKKEEKRAETEVTRTRVESGEGEERVS